MTRTDAVKPCRSSRSPRAGLYFYASGDGQGEEGFCSVFLELPENTVRAAEANHVWTFRKSQSRSHFPMRLLKFHLTSVGGFLINYTVLVALTELAGLYYLLSNLAGIVAAFLWNYTVNVKWTWRK